jgi:hypothetical protein
MGGLSQTQSSRPPLAQSPSSLVAAAARHAAPAAPRPARPVAPRVAAEQHAAARVRAHVHVAARPRALGAAADQVPLVLQSERAAQRVPR